MLCGDPDSTERVYIQRTHFDVFDAAFGQSTSWPLTAFDRPFRPNGRIKLVFNLQDIAIQLLVFARISLSYCLIFSRRSRDRLMQLVEMRSIEVPAGKITVASTPKKVIITDESLIPDEYIRIKREPNKTLIKSALDKKEFVSGAALSNGGTTIQIR